MTGRDHVLAHSRFRAPKEDGAALVEPPLAVAGELVHTNRALLASYRANILGRPIANLAGEARSQLVALACEYTGAYRDIPSLSGGSELRPLVLAGHQPELFHAGVWFKNFVLSSLAKRLCGDAINLLIDNDTFRTVSIRVPSGSLHEPRLEQVPFDGPSDEVPFEEREILDTECFATFGARAAAVIAPFIPNPLLHELWPAARNAASRTRNLGRALAEARHRLEGELGLATLEVPLSLVCESDAFRWFTIGLLAELPRLREVYNASLAEYRHVNKLRSRSHPVPDLAQEQGYQEAPFWLWTGDHPRRRRLFARRHSDRLEVTDRDRVRFDLPLSGDLAVETLRRQSAAGVRLRPRALVTTMYARLFLSDLFVHGIGGGKYDQLTDAILARFFDISPPAFLTATATVRLPIERPRETLDDLLQLDKRARELRFHPERFLPVLSSEASPEVQRLVAKKEQWLAEQPASNGMHARHQGIESVNLALQPFLETERQQLAKERERLAARLRAGTLLGSREFSFGLFPKEFLVPLLDRLAK